MMNISGFVSVKQNVQVATLVALLLFYYNTQTQNSKKKVTENTPETAQPRPPRITFLSIK